jgi:hypothetical protein
METSCSDVEPSSNCFSMYNCNFLNRRSVHNGSIIQAEISEATVAFSGKGVVKSPVPWQVNCRLQLALRRNPFCPLTVFTVPEAGYGNRPD